MARLEINWPKSRAVIGLSIQQFASTLPDTGKQGVDEAVVLINQLGTKGEFEKFPSKITLSYYWSHGQTWREWKFRSNIFLTEIADISRAYLVSSCQDPTGYHTALATLDKLAGYTRTETGMIRNYNVPIPESGLVIAAIQLTSKLGEMSNPLLHV